MNLYIPLSLRSDREPNKTRELSLPGTTNRGIARLRGDLNRVFYCPASRPFPSTFPQKKGYQLALA